ncbi:hypothetical protein J3F84DRAFT_373528, partial [Trichoderma pleuroticola]
MPSLILILILILPASEAARLGRRPSVPCLVLAVLAVPVSRAPYDIRVLQLVDLERNFAFASSKAPCPGHAIHSPSPSPSHRPDGHTLFSVRSTECCSHTCMQAGQYRTGPVFRSSMQTLRLPMSCCNVLSHCQLLSV